MKYSHLIPTILALALLPTATVASATLHPTGNYKNFKVSSYIRAQDVARMDEIGRAHV